mmetsp:Transcript_15631/g.19129  ORF Transcript_15631/g.19129 Transcript_15631/m.19129 type:complete len:135 (-) Transcript_15631:127-531(-)
MARRSCFILLALALAARSFTFLYSSGSRDHSSVSLRAEGKKRMTLQEVREREMMKEAAMQKEAQEKEAAQKYRPGTFVPDDKKEITEDNPLIFAAPLVAWLIVSSGLWINANILNPPKENFSLLPKEMRAPPPQ